MDRRAGFQRRLQETVEGLALGGSYENRHRPVHEVNELIKRVEWEKWKRTDARRF